VAWGMVTGALWAWEELIGMRGGRGGRVGVFTTRFLRRKQEYTQDKKMTITASPTQATIQMVVDVQNEFESQLYHVGWVGFSEYGASGVL